MNILCNFEKKKMKITNLFLKMFSEVFVRRIFILLNDIFVILNICFM